MIEICVRVIGLVIMVCSTNPAVYEVGDCISHGEYSIYCVAPLSDFQIRAQPYVPALGGINCYKDTCSTLGDGTPTDTMYGYGLACPLGMYGRVLDIQYAGHWQCRDHGGAIKLAFGRLYTPDGFVNTWYIPIDFLFESDENYPNWMYLLLDWY